MPFFDRHWWIRGLGAVGLALAACGVFAVDGALLVSDLHGSDNGPLWPLLCFAVGIALLIAAWAKASEARQARSRAVYRRLARAGDADAIPASRIVPDPSAAPDVALRPLVLTWPRHWYEYPVLIQLSYLSWVVSVSCLLISLALSLFFTGRQVPGILIGIGAGSFLAVGIFTRVVSGPVGKPRRLTASEAGIIWEPVIGRARVVRWDEPCLLEVAAVSDDTDWRHIDRPARRYTLYADRTAISWTERAPRRSSPTGDMAALLALIASRTGLTPRTFDQVLLEGGELPPGAVVETIIPDAALPPSPSAVYVLATTHRRTFRGSLIAGSIGLVLTVAGILAALWSLDAMHAIVAPALVRSMTQWLNPVFAFCLLFAGFLGVMLLNAALNPWAKPRSYAIRVDEHGLTQRTTHIAWSSIAGISRTGLGTASIYKVSSAANDTTILWTDLTPLADIPSAGATAVTPAGLAAVISDRSGKPIQVMQASHFFE